MILSLIPILTIFQSCLKPSEKSLSLVTEQCFVNLKFLENGDIDNINSNCQCRTYEFSMKMLGDHDDSEWYPMQKCAQMVGYPNYDEVSSFNEKVYRLIKKYNP